MSLARLHLCQCASRAASALTRLHPPALIQFVATSVWTLARRQGEYRVFVGHDNLGVIWIFYHLFTGLDKFYGFCSVTLGVPIEEFQAVKGSWPARRIETPQWQGVK